MDMCLSKNGPLTTLESSGFSCLVNLPLATIYWFPADRSLQRHPVVRGRRGTGQHGRRGCGPVPRRALPVRPRALRALGQYIWPQNDPPETHLLLICRPAHYLSGGSLSFSAIRRVHIFLSEFLGLLPVLILAHRGAQRGNGPSGC